MWIGLYFLKVFHVVDSKIGWRQELQRGLKSSSKFLWCSEAISLLLCGCDDHDDDEVNGRLDGGGTRLQKMK